MSKEVVIHIEPKDIRYFEEIITFNSTNQYGPIALKMHREIGSFFIDDLYVRVLADVQVERVYSINTEAK